jgi:flagellar capping protein FliD
VFSSVSGLSGAIDFLAELGYQTNGDDDTIALTDSAALDEALASNLSDVQDFFTNATNGLAVTLSDYLEQVAGDEGTLVEHQELLTDQSTGIDDQIASLERLVQANRDQLINQFVAMERMQAQLNQQLQFLLRQIGQGS